MARRAPDPALSIRFDLSGRQTELVKSYSIQTSFLTSCDAFDATLWDPDRKNLRNLPLQPVSLFLHGHKQLIGRIDKVRRGKDGTAVSIQGRDYIADLVESHIDPALKLKKDMAVGAAIELATRPNHILNVVADEDVRLRNIRTGVPVGGGVARADFKEAKLEDYKAQDGEGLYAFCNRLAARQGVTVQPGADRDQVVLAAPNYDQRPSYKLFCYEDPGKGSANTIEDAIAEEDYSKFPTFSLFMGKKGGAGKARSHMSASAAIVAQIKGAKDALANIFGHKAAVKAAVGTGKPAKPLELSIGATLPDSGLLLHKGRIKPTDEIEASMSLYRLLCRRDEDAKNEAQLVHVMTRAIAERIKDTLLYECTVFGHRDRESGAVYSVDTLVEIYDEVREVFETLWIEAVNHTYSDGPGKVSQLTCRRIDSYIY